MMLAVHRTPIGLKEIVAALQAQCGLRIPANTDDWCTVPRTLMAVKRECVLTDALEVATKADFDPTKLLKVGRTRACIGMHVN